MPIVIVAQEGREVRIQQFEGTVLERLTVADTKWLIRALETAVEGAIESILEDARREKAEAE